MKINKDKINMWWFELWHYTRPFSSIRDLYYVIRCRLFKRYDLIRTNLAKTHWIDKDALILHGMMELLVDYVDGEKCFDIIVWDSEPDHKKAAEEIKAIYAWWKNYSNREKQINDQLTVWHNEFMKRPGDDWEKFNNGPPSDIESLEHDKLNKMEEDLRNEEQEMLHRLIDIRRFLWS
jgi:hypothetical protein